MPRDGYLFRIEERAAERPACCWPSHRQPRKFGEAVPPFLLRRAVPARAILIRARTPPAVGATVQPSVADRRRYCQDRRSGPARISGRQRLVLSRPLCFARLEAEARRVDR